MKPVLVLQHMSGDGPAYLGRFLAERGVAMEVRDAEAGDAFPASVRDYAALAILGGEMSANDDLPTLRRAEALFREALAEGVPTLGHCLGGQLMARALGAAVTTSPAPEVGWHAIEAADGRAAAREWFGEAASFLVFQWHYDAFAVPEGAQRLAGSAACPNQAFALGPHLAMQFHVELDAQKLERWLLESGERYARALNQHATVHSCERIRTDARACLAAQQQLAARIYERWLRQAQQR